MLTTVALLALIAVAAAGDDVYGDASKKSEEKSETEEEAEEKPDVKNYDEVYTAGPDGVYAVTQVYGSGDWKSYKQQVPEVYEAQDVVICNNAKDKYGRWKYAYVADAGDAEHNGAVYQYDVVRDVKKAEEGELNIDLENAVLIYGGGAVNASAPAENLPVAVTCDKTGGLFIADQKKGEIAWKAPKDIANENVKADPWIKNECDNAVKNVRDVQLVGQQLFWTQAAEGDAAANNGVWAQEDLNVVDCDAEKACKGVEGKGAWGNCDASNDEAKIWQQDVEEDQVWGVAAKNDKVLFVNNGKKVWQAGKVDEDDRDADETPEEWAAGYDDAKDVEEAGYLGVLVADADGVYATQGGEKDEKKNIAKDAAGAYGVSFYEGEEFGKGDDDDAASSIVLAGVALVAAAMAQF